MGTVTAHTYQWNVSYNGDGSNNSASETNNPTEQVVVSGKASPTLVATTESHECHPGHINLDFNRLGGKLAVAAISLRPVRLLSRSYQGSTLIGYGNGHRQRQRHLRDADRLHAADRRHSGSHLPVERHLQRRY